MESSCALLKSKAERRLILKLRGGTVAFQIEMGRWHGMKREERVCKECDSGEVEDVCHWLSQCSALDHLRQPLLGAMEGSREDFPAKSVGEREQPFYCHWLVRTIVYCQLLALCGQLHSINECLYYTCYQTICHTLY